MGWRGSRLTALLAAIALVVACGGGEDGSAGSDPSDGSEAESSEDADSSEEEQAESSAEDQGGETAEEEPGERMAVISIDGEATSFDLDDLTFSSVEGVDDITFETCDPDFFGSGRFYAIGYAVASDGEILLDDDGQPLGSLIMDLPPDDWEATERDAPDFEVQVGDLDIEIAGPEEAAGGTMSWTIDDTTASGTAVFVDFENTYTVDFEVVCEGSPTVSVDNLPSDDDGGDDDGGGGGFPLVGAGVGSFTADGESFDSVDVYSCEPFSFGSDPDPRDLSLLGYLGGTSGLEVEISYGEAFDLSDGSQFEQISLAVFYSRQGSSGLEQFEGRAQSRADGTWYTSDPETFQEVDLDGVPVAVDASRLSGALAGLEQTWPDEGAATVDVTFDFEIPSEVNEEC